MTVEEVAARTRIDPWFLDAIRQDGREPRSAFAGRTLAGRVRADELRDAKRLGLSDRALARAMGCDEAAVRARRRELGVDPGLQDDRHLRGRVRGGHAVLLLDLRGRERVRCARTKPKVVILGGGPEPDRAGDRVRLLLRARLLRARRGGLRDRDDQLQPGDGLDRLRHVRPPLLRAADLRGRLGRARQRAARRRARAVRRPDAAEARAAARGGRVPDLGDLARVDRPRRGPRPLRQARSDELGLRAPAARRGAHARRRRSRRRGGSAIRSWSGPPTFSAAARWRSCSTTTHLAVVHGAGGREARRSIPVLIDRFLDDAFEFDVDALSDGKDDLDRRHPAAHRGGGDPLGRLLLGAAGLEGDARQLARDPRRRRAGSRRPSPCAGLVNIQFATQDERALRPGGQPARLAHGPLRLEGDRRRRWRGPRRSSRRAGRSPPLDLPPERDPVDFFIKAPVFPFRKFPGEDVLLGPEMKSTGEVMGDLAALRRRVREGVRGRSGSGCRSRAGRF